MEKKEIGTMREKEFKDALQESREYLSDYICVSKDVIRAIQRHAKRYGIMPGICAWYLDWEDFVLTGVISVDIRERRQENCCMEESGNFRFCQMETESSGIHCKRRKL